MQEELYGAVSQEIFEEVKVEAVRILQEFVQGKILKENRRNYILFDFPFVYNNCEADEVFIDIF